MSARRFYYPSLSDAGEIVILDETESRHAVRVMRLQPGDTVELIDGTGLRCEAVAEEFAGPARRNQIVCRIVSRERFTEPPFHVRLCVAVPRAKHMGTILQQATELGVTRVSPLTCEYNVAKPAGGDHTHHWHAETIAAGKQSGNPFLPAIDPVQGFDECLAAASSPMIFGDLEPASAGLNVDDIAAKGDVSVWIGPEGGFSPHERAVLLQRGATPIRVGQHILRVETATVAVIAWLWGRLDGALSQR